MSFRPRRSRAGARTRGVRCAGAGWPAGPRLSGDGPEESGERPVERLWLLHVREVSGRLQDLELRSADLVVDHLRGGDRRARVVLADDDDGRDLDRADL